MPLSTLRRELVSAFVLVFASAMAIVLAAVLWIVSNTTPREAAVYLALVLLVVVGVFTMFGRHLLQRRLILPLEQMIQRIERVSGGGTAVGLAQADTQELARLAVAVDHMAERLIADHRELAANIRSLEDTNLMLTEARDAMVQAEKMASVGRLGAGIAHEVGNPLGALLGYLGILGRHVGGDDRELVHAAELEAQRIDRIVSGLLEYSRPRESRTQPTDVNAVVREALELLRIQGRFNGLELRDRLQRELPPVRADLFQLQQVFVNLFVNAVDALGGTARPWLMVKSGMRPCATERDIGRAETPVAPTPRDMRRAGGPVVEVVVIDNGPGVPPEMIDQIFEPFVTTKEPGRGAGLGLAVCARLIDAMGGSIRADSRTGEGARFTVLLPALMPEQRSGRDTARLSQIDA